MVAIVDDEKAVCRAIGRLVKSAGFESETFSSAEEFLRSCRERRPDCLILDLRLPGMSGLDATREILEDKPETAVLMLSMHSENTWVRQAIDAGAKGYILKNAMNLELGPAVRRVASGETIFDPQVERPSALKGERSSGLTPRELEVLRMIVDGKSNKEIATVLDLSANTVAVHRANIMNALGIHKTAELVVYAIRAGLVNVP